MEEEWFISWKAFVFAKRATYWLNFALEPTECFTSLARLNGIVRIASKGGCKVENWKLMLNCYFIINSNAGWNWVGPCHTSAIFVKILSLVSRLWSSPLLLK